MTIGDALYGVIGEYNSKGVGVSLRGVSLRVLSCLTQWSISSSTCTLYTLTYS